MARQTPAELLGVGEMGIGNTTTSAAVLAVLLVQIGDRYRTGRRHHRGGFSKRKEVIRASIALNQPDPADVVDVLAKVGGFDRAPCAALFWGQQPPGVRWWWMGLSLRWRRCVPVWLCPQVRGYLIPSHASYEVGYQLAMDAMGMQPMLMLGMRLGEGSGCPLAFAVVEAACAVLQEMATFVQAGIQDDYLAKNPPGRCLYSERTG